MEEQKYIFNGDAQTAVDKFAEQMDKLPYDVLFTQFEGNEEVFFSFSMEAMYEEYNALVLSMISLLIKEDGIKASAVSSISNMSYSSVDALALVKQTNTIAQMFLDCGFEIEHEHVHEHEHHDCDGNEDCTCDEQGEHECSCGHNHHIH
ncbi:MAG: hypothetical protein EOM50_05325 [Erysipelotrichia bacterium]|nr:hypothetical protein [Erysipelotrichia bacterium]NCC54559.1 hypothetical protein [Erysipelotrichia bacterium]